MGRRRSAILPRVRRFVPLLVLLALAAGCDSEDAPAPSASFVPGGRDAFEAKVEKAGRPVVVNKWASWCGPCRLEFPFFQSLAAKRGNRIAFLGVVSEDSEDAARTFLGQLPLPYPSYLDPDSQIAAVIKAARAFPATAFYDRGGELVYTRQGGYQTEADLAA